MPIVIGAKRESDFSDPIGMLGDCHRRIERFLNALLTVATCAKGAPLTHEQQAAWPRACVIFERRLPSTPPMKKRACSRDCPDSIVLICRRCLQNSTLYNRITNAPREATARWTIWANGGSQMAGCHLRTQIICQPCSSSLQSCTAATSPWKIRRSSRSLLTLSPRATATR